MAPLLLMCSCPHEVPLTYRAFTATVVMAVLFAEDSKRPLRGIDAFDAYACNRGGATCPGDGVNRLSRPSQVTVSQHEVSGVNLTPERFSWILSHSITLFMFPCVSCNVRPASLYSCPIHGNQFVMHEDQDVYIRN